MADVLAIALIVAVVFVYLERTRFQTLIGWIGASLWIGLFLIMALTVSLLFALLVLPFQGTR